jgi:hypothetical protein
MFHDFNRKQRRQWRKQFSRNVNRRHGVRTGYQTRGGGNTASLLYFLDNASSRILGASLSTTGKFAALTVAPAILPSSAGNDMVVVNKKFLYLPQNDTLTIQAFSIDIVPEL